MLERLTSFIAIICLAAATCSIEAQQTETTGTAAATTTTAAISQTATDFDVDRTRNELREVLHRLPPEVGRVLKIDASLWTNEAYLSSYAPLAEFVARHPEVARNPQFYVRGLWIPLDDAPPESAGVRMWRDMMEGFFVLVVASAIAFSFVWIVRTLIDHRRWSRLARVQADVHTKLLDRFSSSEEVMKYIETPAGQRFLQAAPIPVDAGPRAIAAPIGRVLWSVQVGLIVGALGIGLQAVSWNVEKEVASAISALSILLIAIAAGFLLSAVVSYALSRKLGILPAPPAPAGE